MSLRGNVYTITLTGASQKVLSPSFNRYAITFLTAPGNTGTIAVNNRTIASSSDGLLVAAASGGIVLYGDYYGDLLKGDWFAFGSVATDKIVVIEGLTL